VNNLLRKIYICIYSGCSNFRENSTQHTSSKGRRRGPLSSEGRRRYHDIHDVRPTRYAVWEWYFSSTSYKFQRQRSFTPNAS